jgi:hypothetical protein
VQNMESVGLRTNSTRIVKEIAGKREALGMEQ